MNREHEYLKEHRGNLQVNKSGLDSPSSAQSPSVNTILMSGFFKSWEFLHQVTTNFSTNILHHVVREIVCDVEWI